jgi:hypothetical protein
MSRKRYKLLQLLNPVHAYVQAAAKGKGSGVGKPRATIM